MDNRSKKAKKNIIVSSLCQLTTIVFGLFIPKIMLSAFGSEMYGAVSSIAQFLAYIALLEGGVGGIARAALYKPLAENNYIAVSEILYEIRCFFRKIAYIFIVYVLIIACSFKMISGFQCLDWISSFILVIVISISSFAQYYFGISYSILLQASQKTYVINLISILCTVINTILIVILISLDYGIISVRLISSIIFILRPVIMYLYVKKNYCLVKCEHKKTRYLKHKSAGIGQHLAYFLHSNTDVVILTWFADLSSVAVYSVYNMIVSHIQNLTRSFSSGMEALFGDMLVKKEYRQLHKIFGLYDAFLSIVSTILFSCVVVLILPFVALYTRGIADTDYVKPFFALLLILAAYLTCLRLPYHAVVVAAGHFRETRIAAYGEMLINVIVSILLVRPYGLVGVAAGTLISVCFRFVYYIVYLSKNIFQRKISLAVRRFLVNLGSFVLTLICGNIIIRNSDISDYGRWMIWGIAVFAVSALITIGINIVFYCRDFMDLLKSRKKILFKS